MTSAPEFGVLGPLVVRGAAVPMPRSPVLRRLLGILLVAEGSPVGVPRLTRLVWGPNRAAEVRPGSVHVATSRLRAWLARAAPDSTDFACVECDPAGYRLVVPPQLVDVCRFRRLVGEATAAGDPAQALPLLAEAISLRRGPVLADLDVDREAAPLGPVTELVRAGLVAFSDVAADVGDPAAAVPALERLAGEDPLDETVHEQFGLGLALHGLGQVQAAGEHATAETTLARALEIWDRIQAPLWRARTLHTLGDTLRLAGHAERAVTAWQEPRTIFETLDAPEASDLAERLKTR